MESVEWIMRLEQREEGIHFHKAFIHRLYPVATRDLDNELIVESISFLKSGKAMKIFVFSFNK